MSPRVQLVLYTKQDAAFALTTTLSLQWISPMALIPKQSAGGGNAGRAARGLFVTWSHVEPSDRHAYDATGRLPRRSPEFLWKNPLNADLKRGPRARREAIGDPLRDTWPHARS